MSAKTVLAFVLCLWAPSTRADALSSRTRRPVALCSSGNAQHLYVANQGCGSLSVINLARGRVESEHDLGRSLSDVAPYPAGGYLLAVDRGTDALLLLDPRDGSVRV